MIVPTPPRRSLKTRNIGQACLVLAAFLLSTSCNAPSQKAEAGPEPTPVDVAIARPGALRDALEYTGTTRPVQEVLVRAQVEGQLQQLLVDVGDQISRGQILAQVDSSIPQAAVLAAEAELASRRSEVTQIETLVSEAKTRVEQARLQWQQARADADRLQKLYQSGAISQQQAELARTSERSAEQVLLSAQEQVRTQERAIEAALGRVAAQEAAVAQARERLSYASVTSPITGLVLERLTESGNLLQPGTAVLRLGDFSSVRVLVQVSELELGGLRVGQSVNVRLDSMPNRPLQGRVTRISPAADPTARLIPVEVTLPNPGRQMGSGLLARVSFRAGGPSRVIIPSSALQRASSTSKGQTGGTRPVLSQASLWVITGKPEAAKVVARSVTVGQQADGQVEIISGLQPGERYVVRDGKPPGQSLKEGDPVRFSALSEGRPSP